MSSRVIGRKYDATKQGQGQKGLKSIPDLTLVIPCCLVKLHPHTEEIMPRKVEHELKQYTRAQH
jgi:hypothetical protein